jgi:hypothetical protein
MGKIRMRKTEKFGFEGTKMVNFLSERYHGTFGSSGELKNLEISIAPNGKNPHNFNVFTVDLNFTGEDRRFNGLIRVSHKSLWTIRRKDVLELGLREVRFFFPKEECGRQEVLVVYVERGILLRLCEEFIC